MDVTRVHDFGDKKEDSGFYTTSERFGLKASNSIDT